MTGQAERVFELESLKNNEALRYSSKIVAFTSGKGGTGKTFISVSLAYAISRLNKKVLFIDLDSNLSNANIMLNVVASKTLYDFFTGRSLLHELITKYEPNLHFIFGDSGKSDYPKPKAEFVGQLFNQIRALQNDYDIVLLDTGAGAGEDVISVLLNADKNILVTTPEPTAVMDAYVIIKFLSSRNYSGEKMVIINKCVDRNDGEVTFNNLSLAANHFLKEKIDLLGEIKYDNTISKTIKAQELFIKKYQRTEASLQILKTAKRLSEIIQVANIHHPNKKSFL
ncbi:MAG TPA: AAA family ATPase [Ignavibacteriaceae bacterium]|nr:AAA family ATPase [Ignavibacteriaceae bacterium]